MNIVKWNKKQVAFPGIYSGIDIDRYHSADCCIEPSMSSSGLRVIFNKSPKHYWCNSVYNPRRSEKETNTEAKILGSATHHLLLGEQRFLDKFVIRPAKLGNEPWNGNRNACKQWIADKEAEGLTIVTRDQIDRIKGMAESLREEPLIQNGILNGLIEHSLIWKDKETGIWLKSRPDALPNDSADFADLKTTASVDWEDLRRSIKEYGYYQQAALVAEGCKEVLGIPMNSFALVFVESKEPFDTFIVAVKDTDINRGHNANHYALRKFADCMSSGKWPGRNAGYNDARYIEMTKWAQEDIDARIKLGL